MDWNKYSYVVASQRRKRIIHLLRAGPKMPKEIAESIQVRVSHTSNLISGLVSKGIIICLTPERRKGRLYALTDEGKEIWAELERGREQMT